MKEQIELLGFRLISQCMCGGTLNQTYGKANQFVGYKIKILPVKERFVISKDNYPIAKGKRDIFNETLIKYGFIKPDPTQIIIEEAIREIAESKTVKEKQPGKKAVSKRKTDN